MSNHHEHRQVSRRTLLAAAGAGIAAGPLMAGCARAPKAATGSSGGGKTFTMYWNAGHAYDTYDAVIKQFESDHGVTVNWQKFQWPDLHTKLQADIAAGSVPDLCEYDGGDAAMSLALTGDILALDDYIAKDGEKMGYPSDWQSASLTPWKSGGKTYGIQIHLTCQQLYYNKTMLSNAGISSPPGTWDELVSASQKLTKNGNYGVALNQDESYSFSFFLQNGVKYYDASSKQVLVPQSAALEALQFQYDLVHTQKVSPVPVASSDYSGPQKLLSAGRVAMIFTGPWDLKPIKKGSPNLDLGLAMPLSREARHTTLAGSGVFIPAKSPNPDLAWDMIKRLTALEIELKATKEAQMTMPRKTWGTSAQVKADPLLAKVAQALNYGVDWGQTLAPTGKNPKMEDAYKTLFQSIVISGKKPSSVLPAFNQAAKQILG